MRRQFEVEWDWGARSVTAHVSPAPSTHAVRWVFPSTAGRRLSQKPSLPHCGFARPRPTVPRSDHVQGSGSPRRAIPLQSRWFVCACRPTGPWLSAVYHVHACKRYYGLIRRSGGLRPVYGLSRTVFALAGRPPHLPFFALTHVLRPCRYPYPADGPSSLDGSSLGPTSLHHLLSGSAVSVCPLTGFREVRLTRQQFSRHVAACTLARAADQSPPTPTRRQAHPCTAELARARVSSRRRLPSLLGPTPCCRGGILTRSPVKERRLHQKATKDKGMLRSLRLLVWSLRSPNRRQHNR